MMIIITTTITTIMMKLWCMFNKSTIFCYVACQSVRVGLESAQCTHDLVDAARLLCSTGWRSSAHEDGAQPAAF